MSGLQRVLRRRDLVALAWGAMVGWGWVVLSGDMVELAGSLGSIAAFGIGATLVFFVGLTYAELTAAFPRAGGELVFAYVAIGPRAALLCAWALGLAYLAVCAFEAVALPSVLGHLLGRDPAGEAVWYRLGGAPVRLSAVLVGCAGALAVAWANYRGLRFAAVIQTTAAASLFAMGLAFFAAGPLSGELANLPPLFTGAPGLLQVLVMTPFLFLGFDILPQVAEESRTPPSGIGRLLLLSIGLALFWYAMVQWTVAYTLPAGTLPELAPADAMTRATGSVLAGRMLVAAGFLGLVTSWNAFFVGGTRLLFAMGRAGLLPGIFARLHPRHGSPVAAIVLLTVCSLVAPFLGHQALLWLVNAGAFATVVGYLFVTVAFRRLRRDRPDLERPYRVPWGGALGWAAFASAGAFLVLYLPGSPAALAWPEEWSIVVCWSALGAVLAFFARGHSDADEGLAAVLGTGSQETGARYRPPRGTEGP